MKIAALNLGLFFNRLTLIVLLFTLFTLTLTLLRPAYAQCTYTAPTNAQTSDQELINQFNKCAIEQNVYDDKIFNYNQISGTVDSLNTMILGYSFLHPQTDTITASNGALTQASSLVASLYAHPPASGVEYFASQFQKFNPVQPAYAQATGLGYDSLKPVQKLWTIFRNASYVGFIIVFVVIGFMVMFRAHISAQAVATVQDSIPRIVIALILVTFSYAIAGLMIDVMFLFINIIIQLLAQSGAISATHANEVIFNKSIIGVIVDAWDDVFRLTAQAVHDLLGNLIGNGGTIGNIIKFGGGWAAGGIAGLIVGIAALFLIFRIFLMLLMSYVMIILLTLFAPFFFLIQALPGNNGAKEWFKQMASHIAVFPTVSLMIILAGVIGGISAFGGTGTGELGTSSALKFPLFLGGVNTNALGKIIGLGILFMTPNAAELVKNAIGVKGGPNLGAGLIGGLAAGAAAGKQIGGQALLRAPGISSVGDYLAAQAERPKLRRQAAIHERIPQGWTIPGLYRQTPPEGGGHG